VGPCYGLQIITITKEDEKLNQFKPNPENSWVSEGGGQKKTY